ncbi:8-oxoguanine DNA glycosylase OGG fold protein [Blastococcus sp. VKM Ac-2987]|uniref:8-oxoguanine DNA glycosylase OGG fold protein n=1 Tax=Blastococcus sp. VKM Ac-2987 TaxID=3004141 RepID=UPI0022ABB93F|nr:hypothetical protein [Blastococcus sp. VKM Ac-2987]MCZ2857431.1 hypothetical protein [Blastococcus sp. VKM Ac-2987]
MTTTDGTQADWQRLAAQAEEEAARHPLKSEHEAAVREAIEAARRRLGGDSVESHTVLFEPEKWQQVGDALPAQCMATGRISRGDLFAVAADKNADRAMWRLFVASKVWGYGPWGYGPSRLAKVERATPEAQMEVLLEGALEEGLEHGPMAAYYRLRGDNPGPVAAKHWGSAFFTKALYAGLRDQDHRRPALILDAVLATKVTELGGLPYLLIRGKAHHWSHYRYGVYLAWMGQTADRFEVAPELLEYSLFKADL